MDNRIRALRTARGWTQADLAAALDVSRQTVNALETGKYDPSLPLAFRLSYLFGQPIEQLFTDPHRPADLPGPEASGWTYQSRAATALNELELLSEMGEQGWELVGVRLGRLDFRRPETGTPDPSRWLYQRLSGLLSDAQKRELLRQGWQFVDSWMGLAFHYFKRPLS